MTMRRLTLFLLLLVPALAHAQQPLGIEATASLLTCGPGNEFYTTFGHSAIRITDPEQGIDYVYNYGTFDFDTPHFYWKFMRGQLDYKLARTTYNRFMQEYASEGRAVWEQPLCFESQQVDNLYILLETNLLPEYRYYRYDFFRDNCATRVRDVIYSAWGMDTLLQRGLPERSYRRLVADRLKDTLEWWRLGIDLLFGLPADHRCRWRGWQNMPRLVPRARGPARVSSSNPANCSPRHAPRLPEAVRRWPSLVSFWACSPSFLSWSAARRASAGYSVGSTACSSSSPACWASSSASCGSAPITTAPRGISTYCGPVRCCC